MVVFMANKQCHRSKGDFCLIGPWEIFYAHAHFLCSANKDGCRRLKNMQSILFSRKESIGRSCSSFVMDSNFSLVASFVMVGNNGRDRENFSATYEGLKSAISLCGSLRMSEKGYKAKRGQCVGTRSCTDIKLAV